MVDYKIWVNLKQTIILNSKDAHMVFYKQNKKYTSIESTVISLYQAIKQQSRFYNISLFGWRLIYQYKDKTIFHLI